MRTKRKFKFDYMDISAKKYKLIERLTRVRREGVLDKIEELLIQSEMEYRAQESLDSVEKGEVVSIDEFTKNNESWFKKRATK